MTKVFKHIQFVKPGESIANVFGGEIAGWKVQQSALKQLGLWEVKTSYKFPTWLSYDMFRDFELEVMRSQDQPPTWEQIAVTAEIRGEFLAQMQADEDFYQDLKRNIRK